MQIGRFGRIAAATAAAGLAGVLCAAPAAADTVRDGQWPLQRYGASQSVWLRTQGEGVTVAVIGSGVNAQQQDLVGQVLPGRDFTGRAPDGRYDVTGQGTGTASLIAGHGHGAGAGVMGLAPKVRILPVRIGLTPHGDSVPGPLPPGSGGGLAEAIRYSVDQGVDVINVSVTGYRADEEDRKAVRYAVGKDVVVVASAGDRGRAGVGYPAAYPGVVAVAAAGEDGGLWPESNHGPEVTLTAAGDRVVLAGADDTRYPTVSGTSPATAHVSAAAALVRARFPDLSSGQVINRLLKSAAEPADGTKVPGPEYGAGLLDPDQALTKDIPAGPEENPLLDRAAPAKDRTPVPPSANTDKAAGVLLVPDDGRDRGRVVLIVVLVGAGILGLQGLVIVKMHRRAVSRPLS